MKTDGIEKKMKKNLIFQFQTTKLDSLNILRYIAHLQFL